MTRSHSPFRRVLRRFLLLAVCGLAAAAGAPGAPGGGIPIHFRLDRPGYVTLVVDDAHGDRVRNLIAETYLPAGENTVTWDGYDEGSWAQDHWVRHRVAPGDYHVRGLVHDRIGLRYEFSVNSPGTPPWKTADGSGAWLADHSPPADVLFLPGGVTPPNGMDTAHLLVCSTSGETGEEFVWLTAEGRRLYGLDTGFWGGTHLARDPGTSPDPDYYAYTFESGERDPDNNELEVRGFKADGSLETVFKTTFPMVWKQGVLPQFKSNAEAYGTNGLAVYDGRVVIAWTRRDQLIVADARSHTATARIPLPQPRGLCFDPQGRLYVITRRQVRRYALSADGKRLTGGQTIIASGLTDPRRIMRDAAGNLYVSDWGASHQIKVFTSEGRFVRAVGRPGGPRLGLYDPRRLCCPAGVAVDPQDRLWVAEAEQFPKRLSLWSKDGTLLRAWYGGPKYGGGGAIDPGDKTRFFYAEYERGGGTEFALDWKAGTYRPQAVYWNPDLTPGWEPMPGPAPERALHAGGRTYLTNCFNGQLRFNQDRGIGIWRLDADHVARPVVIIGNGADLVNRVWGWPMLRKEEITRLWQGQDPAHVLFVWGDKNGDGVAEPDEVQYVVTTRKDAQGSVLPDMGLMPLVNDDLSVTTSWGTWIAPPHFDARGTPLYDLTRQKVVGNPEWQRSPLIGGDWEISNQDGVPATLGADLQGKRRWVYPATAEEVLGGPGLMVAPTRPLGPPVRPRQGQAGPLVAISGEMGTVFLLTMDGLFLQTLGGDNRTTPLWRMPVARRGMPIDGVSFSQEHFHPTLTQTADGAIYLVAGHEHSSILTLEGLDTVRRLDGGTLSVTDAMLAGLPETVAPAADAQGRPCADIAVRAQGPRLDAGPAGWPAGTVWLPIAPGVSGAVLLTPDRLYAAWRTGDPDALANAGGDARTLFKYGGALDLMLGADPGAGLDRSSPAPGDLRLLVTTVRGQTKAVLYRAVVPGTPPEKRVEFASPVGRVDFDRVADVSDQVQLVHSGGDYTVAVPLATLGLSPQNGQTILGDIGLLRGSGGQTTQRLYWSNHDTAIVSDIPSEARLQPARWGLWRITDK